MYCVFELMAHSIADQVNMLQGGLDSKLMREYTFQTLCGINYLHSVNVRHLFYFSCMLTTPPNLI